MPKALPSTRSRRRRSTRGWFRRSRTIGRSPSFTVRTERERWDLLPVAAGSPESDAMVEECAEPVLAPGERAVRAQVTGSVWQVLVEPGQPVGTGERVLVLETMKMETAIVAPAGGIVARVQALPGALVHAGEVVLVPRAS